MAKKAVKNNIVKTNFFDTQSPKLFLTIAIALITLLTSAIYLKSLSNDFVNWDDELYVYKNTGITTLKKDSIAYTLKHVFTTYVVGNYHPLTMLTYCVEYSQSQLNPKTYHTTNLILHILNSILVLAFIWLLSKQKYTALFVALLFAVHPMHVESVAWISERKDVLYSFFYLASLCSYMLYISKQKQLFYIITFFLFVLALLSKAMAVTIPVVFIAIDYYLKTPINFQSLKNKIPFFILSLLTGVFAIKAQLAFDAIGDASAHPFYDRILFGCYGIINYIFKLFLPINLSCFYAYPIKQSNVYPIVYYLAPLVVLALVFVLYKFFRTNRVVVFGSLLFLITIALVLQILPVGEAIVADRYTYLPYIGLFFIIATAIEKQIQKSNPLKPIIYILTVSAIIIFSYMSHKRSLVWKNGFILWDNAIQNSAPSYTSYYCRGNAYATLNNHQKAIDDFNAAERIRKTDYNLYYSRGYSYYFTQQYQLAIEDFNAALKLNPNIFDAYLTRGGAYFQLKQYEKAIDDYNIVLSINPNHAPTHCNKAIIYLYIGQYEKAKKAAQKAADLEFNVPPQLFKDIEIGLQTII
jgi:tetratricopeptide (TPR) repeat protein